MACADQRVRINKSTNRRIIISAIEIIESKFGIEVVASVTERIICGIGICAGDVVVGCRAITPSVVVVGDKFCTYRVVNGNNITLKILFKPEGIEDTLHHRACTVDQIVKTVKLTVGGVCITVRLGFIIPYFTDIVNIILSISKDIRRTPKRWRDRAAARR